MQINVLVIGDNRDVKNWGCRSTSIALTQILSQVGNIEVIQRLIVRKAQPIGFINALSQNNKFFQEALIRAIRINPIQLGFKMLGGNEDYIFNNPKKSVRFFRRAIGEGNIALGKIYEKFQKADVIAINGEGSLIFRTPPRRDLNFYLFAVELACQMGKPIHFINTMASDCPKTPKDPEVEREVFAALQKCKSVLVRDPLSKKRLIELGLREVDYCPDALFTWADRYGDFLNSNVPNKYRELLDCWPESDRFRTGWSDFPSDYICVSGASRPPGLKVCTWTNIFKRIVFKIQKETGFKTVLIDPSGDSFLKEVSQETNSIFIRPQTHILMGAHILANAKAYVSGRYHPSILASLGGTPCTFMVSNSHKTRSLQVVLEYERIDEFAMSDETENIDGIIKDLEFKLNQGGRLRNQIKAKTKQHSSTTVKKMVNAISLL